METVFFDQMNSVTTNLCFMSFRNDAMSLPDFIQVVEEKFRIDVSVKVVNKLYDFRAWLGPHVTPLMGHSRPHVFR